MAPEGRVMRLRDRAEAGRKLAERLAGWAAEKPLVLALPRGGVPVGREVADALGAPLDVWVARKLGVPEQPELGFGAIAEGGGRVLNPEVVAVAAVSRAEVEAVTVQEQAELERRARVYRGGRPQPAVRDRTVILVDDGIATGGTVRAAVQALRKGGATRIVVAAPVVAEDTARALEREVDALVTVVRPVRLYAIGMWYEDFSPTTDGEVCALLGTPPPQSWDVGSGGWMGGPPA